MGWLALGIVLGIGIYWAVTIIKVHRVLNRHIDSAAYLPDLWSSAPPKPRGNRVTGY